MQEDGQLHQMDHMHGDIALSMKITKMYIVHHPPNTHVLPARNIMAEDPSNSRSESLSYLFT